MNPATGRNTPSGLNALLVAVFAVVAVIGMVTIYNHPMAPQQTETEPTSELLSVDQGPTSGTPLDEYGPTGAKERAQSYTYLVRFVIVTGLLLVIMVLAARLFKKYLQPVGVGGLPIVIRGRQYLTPKSAVMVVKVQNRQFLLGVGEGSTQLIAELQPDDDADLVSADSAGKEGTFTRIFNQFKLKSDEAS